MKMKMNQMKYQNIFKKRHYKNWEILKYFYDLNK